ncbi:MAG: CsgG/HfaB family protein [Elusimicrobia bacterium]|nr:CsgG/HfaB family protein [Candidatus Obscuribacterium magneticum]
MRRGSFFVSLLFFSTLLWAAADPLKRVAKELADDISRHGPTRVAVLAVPHHDNHYSDGPFLVSEQMATYLAMDKRLKVIERNHIVQILGELRLSETGLMDPKSARRIGEVLGADVIVTGTLIDLDNQKTELNARALLSGSGRIIGASRTLLDRSWEGRPTLGW